MKKFTKGLISGIIVGVAIATTTTAFASGAINAMFSNDFKFKVNGQSMKAPSVVVVDNSTYLGVRSLSEMLGYKVTYDNATQTISLNNDGKEPSVATDKTASNITANTGEKKEESVGEYKKLPVTLTIGDYSMTVNSIKKLEYKNDNDVKTMVNVTVTNNTKYPTKLFTGFSSMANWGLKDEYSLGVPMQSDVYKWYSSFSEKTKTIDVPYRAEIKEGTKNIRLLLSVDGLRHETDEGWFIFSIDATDL